MVNKRLQGVPSTIFLQVTPTVVNYYLRGTYHVREGHVLSPRFFLAGLPKWEERGLRRHMPWGQQRAFTEAERRRQCMWAAIQKPIYRWNGACDEGCNAAICLHVHPPSRPKCHTVRLYSAARRTLTFVWASYVGICLTVVHRSRKCLALN